MIDNLNYQNLIVLRFIRLILKIKLLLMKHLMIYNDKIILNILSNLHYSIILYSLYEKRYLIINVKKKS